MTSASIITKVPHEVRHARALRRSAAVMPMIVKRKERQKRTRRNFKKSLVKPSSGHQSPRPNRHANKRKGQKGVTDAK